MLAVKTSLVWLLLAASIGPSKGDGDVAAAAEAFSLAQRAELAHDYSRAAEFYELADSLAPSPQALRSAAKNRFAAEQNAIAATRAASLLRRYPDSEGSKELAEAILAKTSGALVRVSATCDRPCVLSAGGFAVADDRAMSHVFYVDPGEHEVVASFGRDRRAEESVSGKKGQKVDVRFVAPSDGGSVPPPSAAVEAEDGGDEGTSDESQDDGPNDKKGAKKLGRLHPAYFAVGAILTVGSGAALTWSGVNVLSQNDDYEADPTKARFDDGRSAELRTNVLVATTAVLGAATVVLAVFTDWKRGKAKGRATKDTEPRVAVVPGPGVFRMKF